MPSKNKSLVLIVGAGASKEAGLPLGVELKSKIADALDLQFEYGGTLTNGNPNITRALRLLVQGENGRQGDIGPHAHAAWMIRDAMIQAASIDNFIDAHKDNNLITECGKLSIATCILEAESKSNLKIDRTNVNNTINFKLLENTWYNAFFKLLVEGCQLKDIGKRLSEVSIITFNYDRCIELYIHAALRVYYGVDMTEASSLLSELKIIHPYGFIGSLAWPHNYPNIEFGATPQPHQLIEIANGLKTFTEGTDEKHSAIKEIRSLINKADRLAFLGFAFNKQNLDLLYGVKNIPPKPSCSVYGTALGMSESDIQAIYEELENFYGYTAEKIKINRQLSCAKLFDEFGRRLSFNSRN